MHYYKTFLHATILILLLTSFSFAIQTTSVPGINGPYSHKSTANKNYKGVTLRVLTHVPPNIGEPIAIHAREFEELTGAKFEIKYVPWSEIRPEVINGLKNGLYDIVTPCSDLIPDTAPYLAPVPEEMLKSEQWQDIMPYHQQIATYRGKVLQLSFDGDRHAFQYRKDVLEDIEIRSEFKEKFGSELTVPETWKELIKVAAFLNGRIFKGKKIYGMVEITNKDDLLYSNFLKRASAYAKHPSVKNGFFFDLETMKPMVNTPGWVEALHDFVDIQEYYPPGGKNFGLVDVNKSFGAGEAVFTDNWDDSFISSMEKTSPAFNEVFLTLSPGSRKVWNPKTSEWDHFTKPNRVPYISMGWISGVSNKSKNINAAFDFLGFFSNPVNHRHDLCIGRFGVNPFRKSDLDINFWVDEAGWKHDIARSYTESLSEQMKSEMRTFDLRIPGIGLYMRKLQIGVARALMGKNTPQEALNSVAKEWEMITERMGRDNQRLMYAEIVKMENNLR